VGWLKSIVREVLGLFVDDISFAGAILLWLVIMLVVLPKLVTGERWAGVVLFVGLAFILIESVVRYARRRRK
jgi:membrane protein implicated in regulation of membrane protease activity